MHQDNAGCVFGRVMNQTEPNRNSKPGLLAGYPDLLLTLVRSDRSLCSSQELL